MLFILTGNLCYNVNMENIIMYKHSSISNFKSRHELSFSLIVVTEGSLSVNINEISLQLFEGNILIISPYVNFNTNILDGNSGCYEIYISIENFETVFADFITNEDILSKFFSMAYYSKKKSSYLLFRTEPDVDLFEFLRYLYFEYLNNAKYRERMLGNIINAFFVILLRNQENNYVTSSNTTALVDDNISYILNYIQNNYKDISLASTSKYFNYSERQMARIIKENTGKNFSDLIRELKLNKAAELLKNPEISISAIIDHVGFSDTSSFYRLFKKQFNNTPVSYRNKLKNHQQRLKE